MERTGERGADLVKEEKGVNTGEGQQALEVRAGSLRYRFPSFTSSFLLSLSFQQTLISSPHSDTLLGINILGAKEADMNKTWSLSASS